MAFNLLIKRINGKIVSSGYTGFVPKVDETVINLSDLEGVNFSSVDELGRICNKWDFISNSLVKIQEAERVKPVDPRKEEWKGLTKTEDKIEFLAKMMGLGG